MKKILVISVFLMVIFLSGCGCAGLGSGGGTNPPVVNNTTRGTKTYMEEGKMTKSLYMSMLIQKDDFVVLELPSGQIDENNKYIQWLDEGICYNEYENNYKCDRNDSSRLNIYYGDHKKLVSPAIEKSTTGVNEDGAIRFYSRGKLHKTIAIKNLPIKANVEQISLENYFRFQIIENISYTQIETELLNLPKESGKKHIVINDLDEDNYEFQTLKNLVTNKESFLLLITSDNRNMWGEKFCIFSDYFGSDADCLIEERDTDPDAHNIGNTTVSVSVASWLGESGVTDKTYNELYLKYMNEIARKYGIKFYHVNVTSFEAQWALEKYSRFMAAPYIGVFIDGDEYDGIFGVASQDYVDRRIFKLAQPRANLDFSLECVTDYIIENEMYKFNVSGNSIELNLLYSDKINASYFVGSATINNLTVDNYNAYYDAAPESLRKKITFVENEEDIYRTNETLEFSSSGFYGLYLYSEDVLGNKGIASFILEVHINSD